MMKVLTRHGLKFSSKKMSPAKSTYQVCCIPYSNKFALIWRENVSHMNAGVKEKCVVLDKFFQSVHDKEMPIMSRITLVLPSVRIYHLTDSFRIIQVTREKFSFQRTIFH